MYQPNNNCGNFTTKKCNQFYHNQMPTIIMKRFAEIHQLTSGTSCKYTEKHDLLYQPCYVLRATCLSALQT